MPWEYLLWQAASSYVIDSGSENPIAYDGGILSQSAIGAKVETPSSTLPTVSGSTTVTNLFANEQSLTSTNNLNTVTNGNTFLPATITTSGALIGDSYLSDSTGSNFLIGNGHYWEEAIAMCIEPFPAGTYRHFGNHDNAVNPRGVLRLFRDSASCYFQWLEGGNTYSFSNINIPITQTGPGSEPIPFYYRFVRNQPGNNGTADLRIYYNGTSYNQSITGLTSVFPSAGGSMQLGRTNATNETNTYFFWWRSQGSDTATAASTGTTEYITKPTIYTNKAYYPTGTEIQTFVDSGYSNQYWQAISFFDLELSGGGILQYRTAATESLPSGSATGLFSGEWKTASAAIVNGFPIQHEIENQQGRYLAIALRFATSDQLSLSYDRCILKTATWLAAGRLATAMHSPTNSTAGTINVGLNTEGSGQGSLPFAPDFPEAANEAVRRKLTRFEIAYTGTRSMGTGTRKVLDLQWTLNNADTDTLITFFNSRRAGEQAFTMVLSDDTTLKAALISQVRVIALGNNVKKTTATVMEVI